MPSSIALHDRLESLDIRNNAEVLPSFCSNMLPTISPSSATGSVPSSIALHDRLEALDIRNNALDKVPADWTSAANTLVALAPLVYLRMADNHFSVSATFCEKGFGLRQTFFIWH